MPGHVTGGRTHILSQPPSSGKAERLTFAERLLCQTECMLWLRFPTLPGQGGYKTVGFRGEDTEALRGQLSQATHMSLVKLSLKPALNDSQTRVLLLFL